ncbi:hypothetical protein HZS_7208, partial [Henneguya salminicola]
MLKKVFFNRVRFCHSNKNIQTDKNWFKRNKETLVAASIVSGLSYFIYYTFKKNNSLYIRIPPPIPTTGVIIEEDRIKYLEEKFGQKLKNSKKLQYLCFYGKLGCGKSILTYNLLQKIQPEKNSSFITLPKSKILVFLNCSCIESFVDSLLEFCRELNISNDILFDPFDLKLLDLPTEKLIDHLFIHIEEILKNHPNWIIVLDNINDTNDTAMQETFKTYIWSDFFKNHKGSFVFVCDTNEPLIRDNENTYKVQGLSLNAAHKLFLKHSNISPSHISMSDPDMNSVLHLMHTQPLSVVSFALLVKNSLEQFTNQTIKNAIKKVEDAVLIKVKDEIQDYNINLNPDTFELLYVHTVLEMAIHQLGKGDRDKTDIKLLSILSLLSPFTPSPETLMTKFFNNFGIQGIAATFTDLQPVCIDENIIKELKDPSTRWNIIQIFRESMTSYRRACAYFRDLYEMQKLNTEIHVNERISTKYKTSPFLNITKMGQQDMLSIHPLVYRQIRHKFFTDHYKIFEGCCKSTGNKIWTYIWSFWNTSNKYQLIQLWEGANIVLKMSTTEKINLNTKTYEVSSENKDTKYCVLDRFLEEILNVLSHKDPFRYPNQKMLTHIRSRHIKSLITELNLLITHKNLSLSYLDTKYLVSLFNAQSDAYIQIAMYKSTLKIADKALDLINNKLGHENNQLNDQIINTYLIILESYINQCKPRMAYTYLKSLWSLIKPYYPLSHPFSSAKLIILAIKYNKIAPNPIPKVDNLDLACHGLQKINISMLNNCIPADQLAEEMMELNILYGTELINKNFLDYAEHLIAQAEKFNLEIFKDDLPNKQSPFDKKIFNLRLLEFKAAFFADNHICVSQAMKQDLIEHSFEESKITVFYDRPSSIYYPYQGNNIIAVFFYIFTQDRVELFNNTPELKNSKHFIWHNTALLVSSSSWTDDEDFTILLRALKEYDRHFPDEHLPPILCIITGQGANQDQFMSQVACSKLLNITIKTAWLKQNDYANLLRLSDLGICLHISSSGLDLPMKVVDMLGSGLCVCSYKYNCINELIQDGENGYLFRDSHELCDKMIV